jgi:hypothetical protein
VKATAAAMAMVLLSVPELVKRTSSMPDGEKRFVTCEILGVMTKVCLCEKEREIR